MKLLLSRLTIAFAILALGIAGCSQAVQPTPAPATQVPPEATLTFSGDICTYSGPKSLPGKFNINVVVEGQAETMYGYVLVTIEEGKTIEDLQAWPSTDPPGWLKDQLRDTGPVFGSGNTKQNADMWSNPSFSGGPIFLVCFVDDTTTRKIGALGPIEITK
jgi:hypothetical protein